MFSFQFSSLQCLSKSFQYADLLHKSFVIISNVENCFVFLIVTFDQFKVSLLIECIYLFKKAYWPVMYNVHLVLKGYPRLSAAPPATVCDAQYTA